MSCRTPTCGTESEPDMIRFVPLTGFLGAGKTTTLVSAALAWQAQGKRVAVVTNDQGTELVDTLMVRSELDDVAEVTGGCFCCRFEDLMDVARSLIALGRVDVIIAEAVGSCTDLQATVVRPLRKYHGDQFQVSPLATVVDPLRYRGFRRAVEVGEPESDLSYLFDRQLAESDVIAINKVDVVYADEVAATVASLRERFPSAHLVEFSAATGQGLPDLLNALEAEAAWTGDLEVDYDRYAAAEAQLGWLNEEFGIRATSSDGFVPQRWAHAMITNLATTCADAGAAIGHAKLTVETDDGMTKMSITGSGTEPSVDLAVTAPSPRGRVIVNARVACEPAELDGAVHSAAAHADQVAGSNSVPAGSASFKPGYPTPVHRLAAAQM